MSSLMLRRTHAQHGFRKLLASGLVSAASLGLACTSTQVAFGQVQQQQQQSSVIVLSDQNGNTQKLLNELREKLKVLPEDQRNKILEQVEKSLDQVAKPSAQEQRVVITAVDADGKQIAKDGNTITMTIIQESSDGSDENQGEKRSGRKTRIENYQRIFGNPAIVQGMPIPILGGVQEPMFRIGLSFERPDDDDDSEGSDEESPIGLTVERVMEDSPASEAGIQEGDLILAINGQEAKTFASLQEAVQEAGKADRGVKLRLKRDGQEMTIKVKPTATENSETMNFKLMPQAGTILPLEMLEGQVAGQLGGQGGGAFQIAGPIQFGQQDLSETKTQIAELKEEIQELKAMVKKLLDAAEKR